MLGRLLAALVVLVVAPLLLLIAAAALALADLVWRARLRRVPPLGETPASGPASIIIPSWNGRNLLEKYLPSVAAAAPAAHGHEIIVVDNGSSDGTAAYVRSAFPGVSVIELPANLGFGGGSNAGIRAAKNDIVVLLNNDMRAAPDFLQPLIDGFADGGVFAVSCQIFFSDPARTREETGLTEGRWENGALRVRHRVDGAVTDLFPCFYGGGGSCAFDRRKLLDLGGFDPLFEPFYLEDTDLGYRAWKRGWKVLYQPRSVVWHEHRGTIGRRYATDEVRRTLEKNFILWTWKNIHDWRRLASHFFHVWTGAVVSVLAGPSPERVSAAGIWRALRQLSGAVRARLQARRLAVIDDTEAFRRPLGGYFRDRFLPAPPDPERLRVLFVSPYPILPPVHGGGVFMYQTLCELARRAEVHLVALLHYPHELADHEPLKSLCASAEFLVKTNSRPGSAGALAPHALREFALDELAWIIRRRLYQERIDVLQLEYTPMAQYAGEYRRVASVLFEHDIYFQSIARSFREQPSRAKAAFEYLRALRYEARALPKMDRVQACSRENREYLESFVPGLKGKIEDGLRAGIDTSRYCFRPGGREPLTMLFLGSFRHGPNHAALRWFAVEVLPLVAAAQPACKLVVVGSDPPQRHALEGTANIEFRGYVEDVREPLGHYAVFVCPVLAGSGVRVKLLEAFAAGIPVVSTRLGAEGLARVDGELCALADTPAEFAQKILVLFDKPEHGAEMAARARAEVEKNWDMGRVTERLVESYRAVVREKRIAGSTL
jgi:GT2 family glycosyltransferase/glycosyltransferase involved in cell wall biosynthesis